ncbi:MAG: hypothetical protein Q8M34_09720 [Thermodesulfovibrionales bacterium]|nr:hypothetical protein [Thermodesulfovibrionales bacterium]
MPSKLMPFKGRHLSLPLHNGNLLRREAVEFIDHLVYLFFEGGGVGAEREQQ